MRCQSDLKNFYSLTLDSHIHLILWLLWPNRLVTIVRICFILRISKLIHFHREIEKIGKCNITQRMEQGIRNSTAYFSSWEQSVLMSLRNVKLRIILRFRQDKTDLTLCNQLLKITCGTSWFVLLRSHYDWPSLTRWSIIWELRIQSKTVKKSALKSYFEWATPSGWPRATAITEDP